jgi:hypothetical protein
VRLLPGAAAYCSTTPGSLVVAVSSMHILPVSSTAI